MDDFLTISEISRRSGVASLALRFYERKGLSRLSGQGGHRRYPRAVLRRATFIVFAQKIGQSVMEIGKELSKLPGQHVPGSIEQSFQELSRARYSLRYGTLARLSQRLHPDLPIVGIDQDSKVLVRARRKASRPAVFHPVPPGIRRWTSAPRGQLRPRLLVFHVRSPAECRKRQDTACSPPCPEARGCVSHARFRGDRGWRSWCSRSFASCKRAVGRKF